MIEENGSGHQSQLVKLRAKLRRRV
jgi:hypothetical protein